MDKRLRVTAGPDKGLTFELPSAGIHNIGKIRQHNEICLHDMKLSRVHCQVEVDDGRVVITDLDSESGVFVNGERVTQHQLRHSDVIRIGDTELTFQDVEGSPAETHDSVPSGAKTTSQAVAAPAAKSDAPLPVTDDAAPRAALSLNELTELSATPLGAFELGAVLGKGQHGVVFRARDTKEDRVVALKVLHPSFPAGPEEAERFLYAMKNRLAVRHPHLVSALAVGRTAPYTWIALEFVPGESLLQMVDEFRTVGPPPWTEGFRLAVHIGRALHCIANRKAVHRNVTPANILYRNLDNLYKLNDLFLSGGLAGTRIRHAAAKAKLQAEMAYLCPEQTVPKPTLDIRSDIYCLGVCVYLLLTARPPFTAANPREMATRIRETPPAPPRQHQASIPEPFEGAVLKMLAKRPEDRFQTPAQLLAVLAAINADPV